MASKRFREVHKLTAKFEGRWSNHPADPGGKTMYGVTQHVYHAWLKSKGRPKQSVRKITLQEAEEIYYQNYWLAAKCHRLNPGVDRMVYDAAVNSGVGRSRKWLMEAIGSDDDAVTVQNLHGIRMAFLKRLKHWKTFKNGWTRRVDAMRDKAIKEVRTAKTAPDPPTVPDIAPEPKRSWVSAIIQFILNLFKRN